jgi:hypothetical protein
MQPRSKLLPIALLSCMAVPAVQAQNNSGYQNGYSREGRSQTGRNVGNNYYSGVRESGRGGEYDHGPRDSYRQGYDDRYHQPGGVGPGKGAAIGAAGGAALGAIFGGGLKGAVIGGAAGAGVGALAGKSSQDHRRDEY